MKHMPISTQRVDGCFLKFSKSTWYFFIRKIIGFQKIFSGRKLMNRNFLEKVEAGWSSGKILRSIMVLFLISLAEEVRIFQKQEEVGSLLGQNKGPCYAWLGTFLFFHSQRRWVGGEFEKFRKVSTCSIKKLPAPTGVFDVMVFRESRHLN